MTAKSRPSDRTRRFALAALGIACTALAGVGIVVPGMPTTVFLIAASYLFARSSPRLDRRLRGSRWFGPYLARFAATGGMPRRAKVAALLSMWAGIAMSLVALADLAAAQAATVVAGLLGTATILFRVRTTAAVSPLARFETASPLPTRMGTRQ